MSWKEILKSDEFCDECGDRIKDGESYPVESMPKDFHSGKKGESATLCENCYDELDMSRKGDEMARVTTTASTGQDEEAAKRTEDKEAELLAMIRERNRKAREIK